MVGNETSFSRVFCTVVRGPKRDHSPAVCYCKLDTTIPSVEGVAVVVDTYSRPGAGRRGLPAFHNPPRRECTLNCCRQSSTYPNRRRRLPPQRNPSKPSFSQNLSKPSFSWRNPPEPLLPEGIVECECVPQNQNLFCIGTTLDLLCFLN